MSDQPAFPPSQRPPPGPLTKLLAALFGLAFIALTVMFSLVALAVIAIAGLLFWIWLRWKTRALRRQMADRPPQTFAAEGGVIEGEAVRVDEPPAEPPRSQP